MILIGIDPGLAGAISFLQNGRYLGVHDMPLRVKSANTGKKEVDSGRLIEIIRSYKQQDDCFEAALERVSAMPGQGVTSMFSLGDSFGCARTSLDACGINTTLVQPGQWKRHFNLTAEKDLSLVLARKRFPDAPLNLKKHVDRSEALLISLWLYETKFM